MNLKGKLGIAIAVLLVLGGIMIGARFWYGSEGSKPNIYSIKLPEKIEAGGKLTIEVSADADKVLVQTVSNGVCRNETALKHNGLFYLELPVKEGEYEVMKVYAFKGGNVAVKEVNAKFSVFDIPKIDSLEIRKNSASGKIQIILTASDTSGIEKAVIEVFGKNETMEKISSNTFTYYLNCAEEPFSTTLKVYVFDPFKNSKTLEKQIQWLFKDVFAYWLSRNSLNKELGLAVYSKYPEKVRKTYEENREFLKSLLSLGNDMYTIIMKEPGALNRLEDSVFAVSLAWDLGFTKENATYPTVFAIAEYTIAVNRKKLPMNFEALKLLTNGTQNKIYGKDLVDFEPIILEDNYGNKFVLKSKNVPRDVWGIADFLYRHPYVLKYPKTFEAINAMIQQNYWNFFDDPYGPGYYDKTSYKPTDGIVKEIIDKQFKYFWESTPYAGNSTKRWVYLPWYDSEKLKEWFPDKTERKIVLFEFWNIPPYTADMSNPDENGVWPKVYGINGCKLFVEQLPKIYKIIDDAWKSRDREKYIMKYYWWLEDRGENGLNETIKQFCGMYWRELANILEKVYANPNWYTQIMSINAPDQYLTKNFPQFMKVKFIYGFLRSSFGKSFGGEQEMHTYGIPLAFKSYGIPIHTEGGKILIGPTKFGISAGDWEVNLPKYIRDKLIQEFGEDKFVFNYGGEFGLHSMKEGLEKDDFKNIHTWYRNFKKKLYLWKKEA